MTKLYLLVLLNLIKNFLALKLIFVLTLIKFLITYNFVSFNKDFNGLKVKC
ncbi:hypothetical protein BN1097_260017 [Clostridioides difficile]|uniref:Uncharacterized protein n=1 Tax=Clostridioides difficile TaxID=1496 RepID=A0A069A090_CLODI|nr:hypothetical protein BN1097_260017 [Clostridioides difficile]